MFSLRPNRWQIGHWISTSTTGCPQPLCTRKTESYTSLYVSGKPSPLTGYDLNYWVPYNHPSKVLTPDCINTMTSNLNRHAEECKPSETQESQAIMSFSLTYSKAMFCYLLAKWCASCCQPFAIVEGKELKELFRMLYAWVESPSCMTILHDVCDFCSVKGECLPVSQGAYHYPCRQYIPLTQR